ncbi:MFS transporter permease [Microbacterium sp. zg.Y1090]|uniref:MFS transporter permease n=1 Tax=Microbacterium TaxID=33882 RepID=UPI00214B6B5E|nr:MULTISPECIES: MFS transporter permease [unclassified Microbacterium]MCR2811638.1 MFS transporter permease [Microbacterium sp. zg.Y1084]MCR2818940.1 MFS transporter permease [Microbacterium sp. zg.Y1090]MDL5487589.1 MFS transporter permease [Microbacterium sp. zg-Y1211]WIM27246.1 MFS transporter permease [Microbacterium sp. zg-Y1090]
MWLRRAFFLWLLPAAFVLPLWLLVGWGVFDAGGFAFVWALFIAVPAVFLVELALMLLVRARGTVRAERAVSWWDVLGFGLWHLSVISLGWYGPAWIAQAFGSAALAVGLFWLLLWQLWSESGPRITLMRTQGGAAFIPAPEERVEPEAPEVVVIEEKRTPPSV